MERQGRGANRTCISWPVGRDHDLGGVLSGRAQRELPRYEAGRRARAEELNLSADHADITDWFRDGTELPPAPAHRRCPSAFAAVVGQTLRLPFPLVARHSSLVTISLQRRNESRPLRPPA